MTEPFSLTLDNETILKFGQKTCIESINKMVAEIAKRTGNICDQNLVKKEGNLIELGRLYQAMTELCPSIQVSTFQNPNLDIIFCKKMSSDNSSNKKITVVILVLDKFGILLAQSCPVVKLPNFLIVSEYQTYFPLKKF